MRFPSMAYFHHLALAFVGLCVLWLRSRKARLVFPPGPPAEPIIGHLRIIPSTQQEVVFHEWSKIYGDVMYLHIPGRSFLVLNSLKGATELLDKRSGIYSDRMRLVLYELMGWFPLLTFLPYGKRFQKHRRLLNEYLNEKQCPAYEPLQIELARRMLGHIIDDPQNVRNHLLRFSAAVVVRIAYGRDIESEDDPYMKLTTAALVSATSCGSLGSTPVDFLPFLRYLPSWFPGTYYTYKARSFFPAVREMLEYPFEVVKIQLKEGTAQHSYLSFHLNQLHGNYENEEHMSDLKGSAGGMFAAGTETTHSALLFFLLAMVLFPECQKRAQAEIDEVIGKNRLPEFNDRSSLPYVEAVVQEVFRWNAVSPSGIPHCTIEDDVYNGMFIPKGTVVIPNAYAILRDESIYTDPDSFNPGRYLPKPQGYAEPYPIGHFGFGRRICVGRHLASASVWAVVSSMLATLDIGRAIDEAGNEIVPKVELATALTSHPKPFSCTVKPRNKTSELLIRQAQIWNHD